MSTAWTLRVSALDVQIYHFLEMALKSTILRYFACMLMNGELHGELVLTVLNRLMTFTSINQFNQFVNKL